MLVCAGIGYFLGRSRGMGLQGFFLGLAFGPIGWGLTLLWPTTWIQGPVPRDAASRGQESRRGSGPGPGAGSGQRDARSQEGFQGGPACPRCRRAVGRDAGACPHCGNVLIPVSYRVG